MAQCLFGIKFVFQVLFTLIFLNTTFPYEKVSIENSKLCKLKSYDNNTVVVHLGKGESSAKAVVHNNNYMSRWSGKYSFSCVFSIRAPSRYGIYGVIQNLNFRRDPVTGACKDYVEMQYYTGINILFFKSESVKKQFCGKIHPKEVHLDSDFKYNNTIQYSEVAENGFVTKADTVTVKIYIANEKLKPDEKLDINIVFTAFKHDCNKRERAIQCQPCEWIWENFLLDKVQNCPYVSCLDENHCTNIDYKKEVKTVVGSKIGTKVSIGAVVTIISGVLVFGLCVWISRRMQLWCFGPRGNRQSRMEMNQTQNAAGMVENTSPYGDVLPDLQVPSAPPITDDKDLPPSYSSLFPEK